MTLRNVLLCLVAAILPLLAQAGTLRVKTTYAASDTVAVGVPNAKVSILDQNRKLIAAAVTNVAGEASREGIPPGNYRVYISSLGFETQSIPITMPDEKELSVTVELRSVGEQGVAHLSDDALSANWVRIRVVDAGGVMIPTVVASLLRPDGTTGLQQHANEFGEVIFPGLSPTPHSVILRASGFEDKKMDFVVGEARVQDFDIAMVTRDGRHRPNGK